MSKRTDIIRSMFTAPQPEPLSADNKPVARPKISPGSVRSVKDSLTGIERENDELRHALSGGAAVVEIHPALIDPSPVRDRFADDDEASLADPESINCGKRPRSPNSGPAASARARTLSGSLWTSTRSGAEGTRSDSQGNRQTIIG